MDWAKTCARWDKNDLSLGIQCIRDFTLHHVYKDSAEHKAASLPIRDLWKQKCGQKWMATYIYKFKLEITIMYPNVFQLLYFMSEYLVICLCFQELSAAECQSFFKNILPKMVNLALRLPEICTQVRVNLLHDELYWRNITMYWCLITFLSNEVARTGLQNSVFIGCQVNDASSCLVKSPGKLLRMKIPSIHMYACTYVCDRVIHHMLY